MRPGRNPGRNRLAAALAAVIFVAAAALSGCAGLAGTVPGCGDPLKLAIIAQSVTGTTYVPCITELSPGWSTSGFDPASGGTSFLLDSDRSPGQPVTVRLSARCETAGSSPSPARAPGVLTYTRLTSVSPRFAGTLYDVFPGGCVSYQFDFILGPHIALMEQFEAAVGLYPVQQLRLVVKQKLGVELSP